MTSDEILRRLDGKGMPHNGTDTSVAAAKSHTEENTKTLRARVYVYVAARSIDGAGVTSDEAEAALRLSHQTCSARFNELRNAGLIVDSGNRRATRSGRKAAVYIVPERK